MAKKTNNELLGEILKELDSILEIQKKENKDFESNKKDKNSASNAIPTIDPKAAQKNQNAVVTMMNTIKNMIDTVIGARKIKEKDINHVNNLVESLTSTLSNLKFDKEQVESFNKFSATLKDLNAMMENLNGNFFKTIWKYNSLRGKILGNALAGFYKAFFDAFENKKVTEKANEDSINSLKSVTEVIKSLTEISVKQLAKLMIAMNKITSKQGQKSLEGLKSFFNAIIEIANNEKLKDDKFNGQIKNLDHLIKTLNGLNVAHIVIMSVFLGEKIGRKIGGFFRELIDGINSVSGKKVKDADKTLKSIALLLVAMTASLLIVVIIAASFKAKNIMTGFVILTSLILLTAGLLLLLKLINGKKQGPGSDIHMGILTAGAIAILLLALVLNLAIVIQIGKNNKFADIALGVLVLTIICGIMVGLVAILSNKKLKTEGRNALLMAAALLLLGLVMMEIALVFKWASEYAGEIALGGTVLSLFMLAMIGLAHLASKIPFKETLKGIAALAILAVLIGLTVGAMKLYTMLMDDLASLSWSDLGEGSGKVALVLAGFLALVTGLSAILMIPGAALVLAAGAAALATLDGLIALTSAAVLTYNNMIRDTLSIKQEDIDHANQMITGKGGMTETIVSMITSLDSVGLKAAREAKRIAKNLKPLFDVVSHFMKIIEKMANLRYIEKYDDKGNPVYGKMPPNVFITASQTLAQGFADFISILGGAFDGNSENILMVQKICEQLAPNWKKRFFKGAASVSDLLNVLGKFINVIEKMANLKFVDYYKDDGTPVYKTYDNGVFLDAAKTLTTGFFTFLNELYDKFKNSHGQIESIIDDIADGDTMDLMKCLSSFVDAIDKMANLKFVDHYKDDGTPVYKAYGEGDDANQLFIKAASTLAIGFCTFLEELHKRMKGLSGRIEDIIDDLGDGDTVDLFKAIGAFGDVIVKIADLKAPQYKGKEIVGYTKIDVKTAATSLADAFCTFLEILHRNLKSKADELEEIIEAITGKHGVIEVFKAVDKFLDPCIKIAQGEINGVKITIDELKTNAAGIAEVLTEFVTHMPSLTVLKSFPDQAKLLDKGMSRYNDVIEDMVDMVIDNFKEKNAKEIGVELLTISTYIESSVEKLNNVDFKKFKNSMMYLSQSTKFIEKTLKHFKKMAKYDSEEFLNSLDHIRIGVDNFLKSLQTHHQIRVQTKIDHVNISNEEKIIKTLANKTNKFKDVEQAIKKANTQMERLIKLEKEWNKINNDNVLTKLTENLKKQAAAIKEAVDSLTQQVNSGGTGIQIDPSSIAAGIQQAQWSYTQPGAKTWTKT